MNFQNRNRTSTQALMVNRPKLDPVLRIQGYKDLSKIRRTIRRIAIYAIDKYVELATPSVSYRVVNVDSVNDHEVVLEQNTRLSSPIFNQYIPNSKYAVVFALTVGKQIDEQTIEWMEKDQLVEALFLESAAWMGLENVTKQFVIAVRSWATQNDFRISRRLGPGYSYPIDGKQVQWDLTEQKPLFDLLADAEIPITLLESAAMLPKMSRSGLYGLIQTN